MSLSTSSVNAHYVYSKFWSQVDPRLPEKAQERFKRRLADLFKTRNIDADRASSVLAKAYHDVTRRQILN